jgi:hypothetical protein
VLIVRFHTCVISKKGPVSADIDVVSLHYLLVFYIYLTGPFGDSVSQVKMLPRSNIFILTMLQ